MAVKNDDHPCNILSSTFLSQKSGNIDDISTCEKIELQTARGPKPISTFTHFINM